VDDFVELGPSNAFTGDNLQTITVSAWVNTTSTTSSYIASLKRSSGASTLLSLSANRDNAAAESSGYLGFLTRNYANTAHPDLSYDGGYNDGQWHYLVAVVNGLTRNLYIDGIQRGTDENGMQSVTGNTFPATVGGFAAGSNLFNGTIDDVRIYNYAKSAQEIQADYNSSKAGYFNALEGWWPLNETAAIGQMAIMVGG